VEPGSAAEDAGLQRGDLIKEVDRSPVAEPREFVRAIDRLSSGDSVALLVRRGPNTLFVALQVP
jgi:serine protease Do